MSTSNAQSETQAVQTVRINGSRLYEVVDEICAMPERHRRRSEYFRRCFEVVCRHFQANSGVLNLRLGARTLEQTYSSDESPSKKWLAVADSLVLRAQTDESALVKLYRSKTGAAVAYALAAPVLSTGGRSIGAVAFVVNNTSFNEIQTELVLLNQLLELVVENAPSAVAASSADDSDARALRSVVRATDYRSIHHLSFAIVNSLCSKLSCEQISLGLVNKRDVRLLAVSGLDTIPKNTPGIMAVQQAMSVCLDRNEMTVVQENRRVADQCESSPCRVHQFWHRLSGESAVATIPLRVDGRCVAVVALRRKSSQPFVQDLGRARVLAESFAPALPLVDQASRSVARHLMESFVATSRRIFTWQHLGRKLAATIVLAILAWAVFGKMNYHVLAPCRIVPQQINVIAAPFEGRVADVVVQPGQHVVQGQLILRMDTRDMQLEHKRILTEIAAATIECNQLLQDRKANEAFLLQAQIRVLQTDLELINQQLQHAEVRALDEGVVLPTEIHRRVGQIVNLGEPLLEIADGRRWRLEIEATESDSRHLQIEQTGQFQTFARPDQPYECRLSSIEPAAKVVNQKNVVVAQADLLNREPWMRVGMEGHVRIRTNAQPVWWIYGHRLVDYLRMKLWL